jgi:hypothetical protein
MAIAACSGAPTPSSSAGVGTSTPSPTVSPTLGPTAPSVSAPVSTLSPTPRPAGLFSGGFARITVAELNVRVGPSIKAERLMQGNGDGPPTPVRWGKTSGFDRVFIFAGPVDADGYTWWQVAPTVYRSDGVSHPAPLAPAPEEIGWVAGGDADHAWLVAGDECPKGPVELADITMSKTSWGARVACFGGQVLTLRGWLTTIPPDWLASKSAVVGPGIFPVVMGWFDDGNVNRLSIRLHPAMSLEFPSPEQWIEVTGAFDDPTAAQCLPSEVLECRAILTVTSIRPLGK